MKALCLEWMKHVGMREIEIKTHMCCDGVVVDVLKKNRKISRTTTY